MGVIESPFKPMPTHNTCGELETLLAKQRPPCALPGPLPTGAVVTARLHGFDLQDSPVLSDLPQFPGELVTARTTVALRCAMVGARVLVLHEQCDWTRPIVVGVLQDGTAVREPAPEPSTATRLEVQADGERLVLSAEREIVLRCGDASITLTRAGKVLIKGNYILSRASGYNKIKGAAVDIN